jgi:hypothetical protein
MATYVPIDDTEVAPEAPVTTSLMTRLRDNALAYLGAPTGTRTTFQQTTAPLGWTKDNTHNNKAIRLTTGPVGSGGTHGFNTVFAQSVTGNFTLLETHLPSLTKNVNNFTHHHQFEDASDKSGNAVVSVPGGTSAGNFWRGLRTGSTTGDIGAAPSISFGGNTAHQHVMDIRVQYVDFIIAEKAA